MKTAHLPENNVVYYVWINNIVIKFVMSLFGSGNS